MFATLQLSAVLSESRIAGMKILRTNVVSPAYAMSIVVRNCNSGVELWIKRYFANVINKSILRWADSSVKYRESTSSQLPILS